jgi:hypothetical protein
MNNRERTYAVMNYQACDRLQIIHFGYWRGLLHRWMLEGHINRAEERGWEDRQCRRHSCFQAVGI